MSDSPQLPTHSTSRFVNELRLSARQWVVTLALFAAVLLLTSPIWKRIETFATPPDYRIPYALSRDYWLYQRRLESLRPDQIALIGDSVVWGEYVRADGTLSAFLNQKAGKDQRFVNAGVNGLFPLALEGLVEHYGHGLRGRRVIVHANVLWMTSPQADLSSAKEERFNHADLVPQLSGRPPCYRADLNRRLTAIFERSVPFLAWANHLQVAYYGQKSLTEWTLEEDASDASRHPNAFRNPLAPITLQVPSEPAVDPQRGPDSPRHKPWSTTGEGSTRFEWVPLGRSLQWAALQRLLTTLRQAGCDVLVIVGPFNEHLLASENQSTFRGVRDGVETWLSNQKIAFVTPAILPSSLYADASHPLTAGYQALAEDLLANKAFQSWLNHP